MVTHDMARVPCGTAADCACGRGGYGLISNRRRSQPKPSTTLPAVLGRAAGLCDSGGDLLRVGTDSASRRPARTGRWGRRRLGLKAERCRQFRQLRAWAPPAAITALQWGRDHSIGCKRHQLAIPGPGIAGQGAQLGRQQGCRDEGIRQRDSRWAFGVHGAPLGTGWKVSR